MRLSNKAMRQRDRWNAAWGPGLCGWKGRAQGTQHFFQKRLRPGWGREGTLLPPGRLQGGHGPFAGEFVLSPRLWNCLYSQPEQGPRGQTREQGLDLQGAPSTGPGRGSPGWVWAAGLSPLSTQVALHVSRHRPVSTHLLWGRFIRHLHWPRPLLGRLQLFGQI